jgi:hypothetical protein
MAEIHAAAKRLKVTPQPTRINQDQVDDSIFEQFEEVIIDDDDKYMPIMETEDKSTDTCRCVLSSECPVDKMEFTFGKSCNFGYVRCCHHLSATITTTTTTPSTTNAATTTDTTTTTTTTTAATTTTRNMLTIPTTWLVTKAPEVTKVFYRHSMPSVMNKNIMSLTPDQIANQVRKQPVVYRQGPQQHANSAQG